MRHSAGSPSVGNAVPSALVCIWRRSLVSALLVVSALVLTVLSLSNAARAEDLPSLSLDTLRDQAQTLIDNGKVETAFELVAAQEAAGSGNPDYDYLLGTIALAAGKNLVAVHALERAVLVQPSHAGAWLDLSIAHFRLGSLDIADGMLKHIEEEFDPPQQLRTEIAEVRRRIARARAASGWQAEMSAFAGQTSNANFGLAVSSLQLNLGGPPVSLQLDPSYSPRSDRFNEIRASATGRFDHEHNSRSELYAALRYRTYGNESGQDQRDATVSGTWLMPAAWSRLEGANFIVGASARNLAYPGRGINVGQLSSGLRLPVGRCQLTARLDYEQRQFSGDAANDASIPWLGGTAECGEGDFHYGGQQRLGKDFAINSRPGGDSLRSETIVFGRWQARPNLQLGALMFYAYAKDADTYSPILANGQPRWIQRFGQKIELIWAPSPNPRSPWAIVVEFENIRDRSNIGLSSLSISQFQVGLIYRYF